MQEETLPSFRKPPVVETVLGVQFVPLSGLTNAHLGAFWSYLASSGPDAANWSKVTDAPLIPPVFERFNGEGTWERGLTLRLTQEVATRLQIRKANGDAMIQVQNGRLHYNWIGHRVQQSEDNAHSYPRYSFVRPQFLEVYEKFESFLSKGGLGTLRPNQWEVTYVNHIPKGSVWSQPSDWSRLFVGLLGGPLRPSKVRIEGFAGAWHFEIPDQRGRLHVDLKHARLRGDPSKEVLRLTLTARGPTTDVEGVEPGWVQGLELGHQVLVLTFKGITSQEAHRYWELET